MTTFLNGKPGIIDLIRQECDTVLLTEAEYAQRFPTVPVDQHATYEGHRYWVSWWSDLAPEAYFKYWDTGRRFPKGPNTSFCAVIDAASEEAVWQLIEPLFPDCERRFISEKPADWTPVNRFQ